MVFVHTGNSSGEVYYRLGARIKNFISFSVIEPFNLYHPNEATYGIKNIAARYVQTLKRHQPKGAYIIGGWCYGGVVAHEMACQLEQAGEDVQHLFMLDSHAITDERIRKLTKTMFGETNREYFETSSLFQDLREGGMIEAVVNNYFHVAQDIAAHTPSYFQGDVTYFKPDELPSGQSEKSLAYWNKMMEFEQAECRSSGFFTEPNQVEVLTESVFFMRKSYRLFSITFDNHTISIAEGISDSLIK